VKQSRFIVQKKKEKVNWGTQFCDPLLSQIEKIIGKYGTKFLDLYASIYGAHLVTSFVELLLIWSCEFFICDDDEDERLKVNLQ
jgi:hypothetical protein